MAMAALALGDAAAAVGPLTLPQVMLGDSQRRGDVRQVHPRVRTMQMGARAWLSGELHSEHQERHKHYGDDDQADEEPWPASFG
jgi:hypothetical protein